MKKISWTSIPDPNEDPIRKTRAYLDARATAIGFIGISKKASGRVRTRLEKDGVPDELIRRILSDLAEDGYLDDRAFGQAILDTRARKGVESLPALRVRLLRLGVAPDIAEELLDAQDGTVSRDALTRLLYTKFGSQLTDNATLPYVERRKLMGRMARFLASRGFSGGEATEAVFHVMGSDAGGLSDDL